MSPASRDFTPAFAGRIEGLVQSDIRRMSRECERLGGVNLGQGVCDQPAPDSVKEAARAAIASDLSTYSKFEGLDELRNLIAQKMDRYNGVRCDPATQIIVTVGSTGGFALACLATLEPGDEVILFSPFYSYHLNILKMCGAVVRFVTMRPPTWEIDPSELREAFGPRTKMVIINTPSNPSGKVYTREELDLIASLCRQSGSLALTDEIYEYILYDGNRHVSLAALPGMEDRTITLSGFSKTYSMTGWRLGYAVAPEGIAQRMGVLNDLLYICAPTPLQHGVIEALRLPDEYYRKMNDGYARKLAMLCEACETAGLAVIRPQGSYYLLADISSLGCGSDTEAANLLLSRGGVASVPGSSFYSDPADGRNQVRFCFAVKDTDLEEACRRLRAMKV